MAGRTPRTFLQAHVGLADQTRIARIIISKNYACNSNRSLHYNDVESRSDTLDAYGNNKL